MIRPDRGRAPQQRDCAVAVRVCLPSSPRARTVSVPPRGRTTTVVASSAEAFPPVQVVTPDGLDSQ